MLRVAELRHVDSKVRNVVLQTEKHGWHGNIKAGNIGRTNPPEPCLRRRLDEHIELPEWQEVITPHRFKGKTVIDATNRVGADPPAGFRSNAEFVKSKTNGPTAKSFNINFAALYDRLRDARAMPSNLWCGDDEAREIVQRLSRDAGYEAVYAGPLANAAAQESLIGTIFAISRGGMGPFVYRIAPPDKL